jgi:hypothetical protein
VLLHYPLNIWLFLVVVAAVAVHIQLAAVVLVVY